MPTIRRSEAWIAIPLLIALIPILWQNLADLGVWATRTYPERWEAGIIVESARYAAGMPVYEETRELPGQSHSSHMYGPAITVLLGSLFKLAGPSIHAGRALSALCAAIVVCLAAVIAGRGSVFLTLAAAALFLAIDGRIHHHFAETRPDMLAALLALGAVIFFYRWLEDATPRRWRDCALGALLSLAAFLTKQMYAAVTLMPILVVMTRRQAYPPRKRYTALLLPAVPLLAVLLMRVLHPALFHHVVSIAAGYPFYALKVGENLDSLLAGNPLFLASLAGLCVLTRRHGVSVDAKLHWVLASILLWIPVSTFAYAKHGGFENSNFPVLLSTGILSMIFLARWIGTGLPDRLSHPRMAALGMTVALLAHISSRPFEIFPPISKPEIAAQSRQYLAAIEIAKKLPGRVLCPDDPTIPLFARNEITPSAWLERDNWRAILGDAFLSSRDLASFYPRTADYIIGVRMTYSAHHIELLPAYLLRELGYRRLPEYDAAIGGKYHVWRREIRRPLGQM